MELKSLKRTQVLSTVMVLVSMFAVLLFGAMERSWWTFGFAAVGLVFFTIGGKLQPRTIRGEDQSREEPWRLMVDTINRNRHDLMNDLQVLYGYIRLKKYDKLHEFMENIKLKAVKESQIAKIGPAELTAFLLSFENRYRDIYLDLEIDSGCAEPKAIVANSKLTEAIRKVSDCFVGHVGPGETLNRLFLRIVEEPGNDKLRVDIGFSGNYVWSNFSEQLEKILTDYSWRWSNVEVYPVDEKQYAQVSNKGITFEFSCDT